MFLIYFVLLLSLHNVEEYCFGLALLVVFLFKGQVQAIEFRIFFGSDLLNAELIKYENVFVS